MIGSNHSQTPSLPLPLCGAVNDLDLRREVEPTRFNGLARSAVHGPDHANHRAGNSFSMNREPPCSATEQGVTPSPGRNVSSNQFPRFETPPPGWRGILQRDELSPCSNDAINLVPDPSTMVGGVVATLQGSSSHARVIPEIISSLRRSISLFGEGGDTTKCTENVAGKVHRAMATGIMAKVLAAGCVLVRDHCQLPSCPPSLGFSSGLLPARIFRPATSGH